jgi:hypothetical protein
MMKKMLLASALLCAALGAVSAQEGAVLLDVGSYSKLFLHAGGKLAGKYYDAISDADYENISAFGGRDLEDIDTPLEIALLSTCAGVIDIRPAEADRILPANNPRLSDLKLGAAAYMDMQAAKFLGSGPAPHEAALQFITGRGRVTEAEVESFYRQNIGALIAAAVDAEFNKIKFLIENTSTSHGAVLTRDTKNGQYILSYEGYYTNYVRKILSAPTPAALEAEMRKNKTDFDEAGIQSLRNNATLIPAIRLGSQALEDIKVVLGNFYISPNSNTYAAVQEIYVLFANKSAEYGGNQLFEMIYFSYTHTLTSLNNDLLKKVIADAKATKPFVALSREMQQRLINILP